MQKTADVGFSHFTTDNRLACPGTGVSMIFNINITRVNSNESTICFLQIYKIQDLFISQTFYESFDEKYIWM